MNKTKEDKGSLNFGTKEIDKQSQAHLLVETAKACYIMSRSIITNPNVLFYYPAAFFVMHHSLESFIKAFLLKENIVFKIGQKGHELSYLLALGKDNKNLKFFEEILKESKELLGSLDKNYNTNKYWEVGFNVKSSILDIFDKLISILTEQFHQLYEDTGKEPSINIPEELINLIEYNRKYPITLCVLPKKI